MKLQVWLTEQERDLLVSALQFLRSEIAGETINSGRTHACRFTERRITEMMARLAEKKTDEEIKAKA